MANTHYCVTHDTVFFKKGKMPHYAHPIDGEFDDNGKQVWCNEPEETEKPLKEKTGYKADPEKMSSIETQNALSNIVSLMVAGIIKKEDPLGQAAISYAASKLSKWYSQGEIEEVPSPEPTESKSRGIEPEGKGNLPKEKLCSPKQRADIFAMSKEKGYTAELALSIMTRLYHKTSSTTLTSQEADDFIKVLESGKYLKKEDAPF